MSSFTINGSPFYYPPYWYGVPRSGMSLNHFTLTPAEHGGYDLICIWNIGEEGRIELTTFIPPDTPISKEVLKRMRTGLADDWIDPLLKGIAITDLLMEAIL